eukprot:CAMPEP_0179078060 /NCGR_PEP_ID=MMETSP0796-20121207/34931_1 /TAXON_ID=73915 /ORGANISM="Pyrodinium bahamense, Strain pbaha01" /LENGTH=34 /DNA_ID= /DNA_START= /DNA_END= /DNA_ORIENTATION=
MSDMARQFFWRWLAELLLHHNESGRAMSPTVEWV